MKNYGLAILVAFGILLPGSAMAFECPVIGKKAQAQIDEISKMAEPKMSVKGFDRVTALLANARAELAGGLALHSGAHGKADHGLSVAKIKAASGYAYAAGVLLKKL